MSGKTLEARLAALEAVMPRPSEPDYVALYSKMTDAELEAACAAIAKEHGFASWKDLEKTLDVR